MPGDSAATAMCPVMHSPVHKKYARSKRMVRTFQGETIYLCCPPCVKLFDKNPAKYGLKLNQEEGES